MECAESNKRSRSWGENDVGGKRGKFPGSSPPGRGRGGGSFREFAGGEGEGQRGPGFRGRRGGFRGGRGGFRDGEGGGFRGGRGGFRDGEGGGFRGGRGGFRDGEGGGFRGGRGGFRGGRGGFRDGEGGGFRGGRGGFRGGRGGFRDGEGGGFRGGRGGFRDGEGGGFRRGRGGFRGGRGGFRDGEGGGFRDGEDGGFKSRESDEFGQVGFRECRVGGESECGNETMMDHVEDGLLGQKKGKKVLADFPEMSDDSIHGLLNSLERKLSKNRCREKLPKVEGWQPDKLKIVWDELVKKVEPPTFQNVLESIKRLLVRTQPSDIRPEVPKLFRQPIHEYKEKENLTKLKESHLKRAFRSLKPCEKAVYLADYTAKKNNYELRLFCFYKVVPKKFLDTADILYESFRS